MNDFFTVNADTVLYAFRYCLGRHSYAEKDGLDLAGRYYRTLPKRVRSCIREDLRRHVQDIASPDFPRGLHGPCGSADLLAEFDRFEETRT